MSTELRILIAVVLLACFGVQAQALKNFLLAARRGSIIEVIDPVTLKTVSQIHFDVPSDSAGPNGVLASANGTVIYVEGPTTGLSDTSGGCCFLYSVDLATLKAKRVAGIWGSRSHDTFVDTKSIVYRTSELAAGGAIESMGNDKLCLDPADHMLFGVRCFRGPALHDFDLVHGSIIRPLALMGLDGDWWPSGTWSADRFHF